MPTSTPSPAPTQKSAGGSSFKQLPLAGNWLTGERATAEVPFTEQADYTSKQAQALPSGARSTLTRAVSRHRDPPAVTM